MLSSCSAEGTNRLRRKLADPRQPWSIGAEGIDITDCSDKSNRDRPDDDQEYRQAP